MKKRKMVLALLIGLMIMVGIGVTHGSEVTLMDDVEIIINQETVTLDTYPRLIEERTLVPARFIFEPLGAEMEWDEEEEIASGIMDGTRVDIPIGSSTAYIDEEEDELEVSAQIFDDRTFIPLRFAGEAFGADVTWDDDERTITVIGPDEESEEEKHPVEFIFDEEEIEDLEIEKKE